MEFKQIEKLALLMEKQCLTHIEIEEDGGRLVLKRELVRASAAPVASVQAPVQVQAAPSVAEASAPAQDDEKVLKSPIVGCVYLAPSPDAEAFVTAGSKVSKGQTLCIVEAMKVMNEFVAPQDGIIAEICIENGQMVEYGQPLFRLQ